MTSTERPLRMEFEDTTSSLTIFYRTRTVRLQGCKRDKSAPVYNRKTICQAEEDALFNVEGIDTVSFVNVGIRRLAKHSVVQVPNCTAMSMVELRPWLRGECRTCLWCDRQGSFGHYFVQHSFVAAPLT